MVDREYNMGIYKSVKKSIGKIMKNPEMLYLFLIILKLKRCLNMQLKKYLI